MRNLMTLSAAALALVTAPAFAQDSTTADVSAVDPAVADAATTSIQDAQKKMDEADAETAAVDPAAAITATSRIHAGQEEMKEKMDEEGAERAGGKRGHHGDFFKLFSTLDADGDGSLTEQEIRDGAGSIVSAFDENGDGAISKDDMGQKRGKGGWDKRPGAQDADDGAAATDEPAEDESATEAMPDDT